MAIFATPGGTPLNQAGGFQGTQPGNVVGATLQPFIPGVGLFPPNANTSSGDTVLAACSRGALPINVDVNNFGATSNSGTGPGSSGGRHVAAALSDAHAWGTGQAFSSVSGGSSNNGPAGGNTVNASAGGMNQTNAPSAGQASIMPANAPAALPTMASPPVYRG
jgi:hypothetical protein